MGERLLEALARETKAFQRPRGVRSGTDLMRLALAWGPGGYSMQRVAAWAGEMNIATLTEDALVQRLHAARAVRESLHHPPGSDPGVQRRQAGGGLESALQPIERQHGLLQRPRHG